VGTKSLLVMAQDRLIPYRLGQLNQKFGTPHGFLTIIWVLSVCGILSGFSLETLASYAALGALIVFLPVQIAALRLPTLYPEKYRNASFKLSGFWLWFCPLVGIIMVTFFGIIILFELRSVWKIGWFFVLIASGMVTYFWRRKILLAKGIRLSDLLNAKDCWDD